MKKLFTVAAVSLSLLVPSFSFGSTVFCVNCSDRFVQAMERATSISQLTELTSQTHQQIQQTVQQIELVKRAIQNTMQLPVNLRSQLTSQLTSLAQRTMDLKTYRGEQNALAQVFNKLFPEQSEFADLAGAGPDQIAAANQRYQDHYNNWSQAIDESSQATFQLSGSQLKDMEDSGQLQDYINNLVETPDGQMQALQAGNQLAAIQIQEARQFRELMATKTQSDLAGQIKEEKIDEAARERWIQATKTDKLEAPSDLRDPLP
jgi:P-type conjugative transfer protein TrbJ